MQNRDVLVHLYLSVQIGIGMVPSFLVVAVKHSDLKALRRKGFSCLQFQVSHQAERSGQELKAGTCSRNHGEGCSPAYSLWLAQLAFSYSPGPPDQGWCRLQWVRSCCISNNSDSCP